jgi:hypothetical protein
LGISAITDIIYSRLAFSLSLLVGMVCMNGGHWQTAGPDGTIKAKRTKDGRVQAQEMRLWLEEVR